MKNLLLFSVAIFASVCGLMAQSGSPLPAFAPIGPVVTGTVPSNGTNAVETFLLSGTTVGGTIQFGFKGKTANLVLTGTENATLISSKTKTAVESMATIGSGNTSVATTGTSVAVTFGGLLAKLSVPLMSTAVTSGSITVTGTLSTPGVTADGRDIVSNNSNTGNGVLCISLSGTGGGPALYINSSTTNKQPNWLLIGPAGQ